MYGIYIYIHRERERELVRGREGNPSRRRSCTQTACQNAFMRWLSKNAVSVSILGYSCNYPLT